MEREGGGEGGGEGGALADATAVEDGDRAPPGWGGGSVKCWKMRVPVRHLSSSS